MSYEPLDDAGRQVKLRKPRNCEWCGQRIEVGEVAAVRVYVHHGDFHDERMHPECHKAMQEYFTEGYEDEFLGGLMARGQACDACDVAKGEAK